MTASPPPPSMLETLPLPPFYEKGGNIRPRTIFLVSNLLHPPGPRRIYFTTKQKISERLGLRCLGLLAPRFMAWCREMEKRAWRKCFPCVGNNWLLSRVTFRYTSDSCIKLIAFLFILYYFRWNILLIIDKLLIMIKNLICNFLHLNISFEIFFYI